MRVLVADALSLFGLRPLTGDGVDPAMAPPAPIVYNVRVPLWNLGTLNGSLAIFVDSLETASTVQVGGWLPSCDGQRRWCGARKSAHAAALDRAARGAPVHGRHSHAPAEAPRLRRRWACAEALARAHNGCSTDAATTWIDSLNLNNGGAFTVSTGKFTVDHVDIGRGLNLALGGVMPSEQPAACVILVVHRCGAQHPAARRDPRGSSRD
jgi:hypothetical protein